MCQCNPSIRTPFCGKGDCVWPHQKPPAGARDNKQAMPNSKIDVEAFITINSFPAEDTHSFIEQDCMSVDKVRELAQQYRAEIDRRDAEKAEAVADAILSASSMGVAWRIDLREGEQSNERSLGGLNRHALIEVIKAALSASAGG